MVVRSPAEKEALLSLMDEDPKETYRVEVKFDGHLMYSGRYKKEENLSF